MSNIEQAVGGPTMDKSTEATQGVIVFLVHGWKDQVVHEINTFLTTALGLQTKLMMSGAHKGRTLTEKFEQMASEATYALFFLTADERVLNKDGSMSWRPRPNVFLELGWFWGRLGRVGKLSILKDPQVELPSDIKNLGYINLEDINQAKTALIMDLRDSGLLG
jgi:predicted nucleotide-binding protein